MAAKLRSRLNGMITATRDGVVIDVRVIPRAAKSGIAGTRHDVLLVRLHAPPIEGAANEELIEVMAKALGVPRRAVGIVAGEHARQKRVSVSGVTVEGVTVTLTGQNSNDV